MRYLALLSVLLAMGAQARADVVKLPVLGGAGGEHFEYQCADNGYLVDLRAYVGLWIDNVQAVCAKYDPATGRMRDTAPEGPVFGGAEGRTHSSKARFSPCVRDQLIYSFDATETGNQPVLGRIRLSCLFSTTLQRPKPGESNDIQLLGGDELKGKGFGSAVKFAVCPDGTVAVGIRGRSGIYLDAFGVICGPVGRASARSEPMTVALVSADGSRATYTDPMIRAANGEFVLLDWCREWGTNCGKPAAEAYCKNKGYAFAGKFEASESNGRTGIITSGAICAGELCTGFRKVSCSKSDVLEAEQSQGPSPFGAGTAPSTPDRGILTNRPGASTMTIGPMVPAPQPAQAAHDSFTGVWATVTAAGGQYTMTLTQSRRGVKGSYTRHDGGVSGAIKGRIVHGVLLYRWTEDNGGAGSGTFKLAPDGNSFEGWWNSGDDPNVAQSSWKGTRK